MIVGIGNDIIEVERIRKSIKQHGERFFQRILTQKEQEYCLQHNDAAPRVAGRFSAKEAIAKALGTGFGEHLAWLDIEIINDLEGKPEVFFSEKANKRFHNPQVLLSISHCKEYATAVALLLSDTRKG